jgi:ABC-2 type transport system permease protein
VNRRDLTLLGRWTLLRLRVVARTPRAAFFTFFFPLMFMLIFNSLNNSRVKVSGGSVHYAQFFTPGIGVFALITACYTTLIFGLATARDKGIVKRARGLPLAGWVYPASWVLAGSLSALVSVVFMFVVAVPVYGVHIYARLLPAAAVFLVLGAITLSSLGLVVSSFVKRAESAPAVANFTLLPLSFISGIWYPLQGAPGWLLAIAHAFPLSHLAQGFENCFNPHTSGSGFDASHLWPLAAWGAVAMFVAIRRMRREMEGDVAAAPA